MQAVEKTRLEDRDACVIFMGPEFDCDIIIMY